jgi:hypothetical protein
MDIIGFMRQIMKHTLITLLFAIYLTACATITPAPTATALPSPTIALTQTPVPTLTLTPAPAAREIAPVFLNENSVASDIPKIDIAEWTKELGHAPTPKDVRLLLANMLEKVPWHTTLGIERLVMHGPQSGPITLGAKLDGPITSVTQIPYRTSLVILNGKITGVPGTRYLALITEMQTAYDTDGNGEKDVLVAVELTSGNVVV